MEYKLDHKLTKAKSTELLYNVQYFDVDLESNHIYLVGADRGYDSVGNGGEPGVEFFMANRFIKNMNLCMRLNPDKPILIHLKTCGGLWEEGMAIYDMMKSCPSPITVLNYTHARSMSSIILQAATKRVMMPNSHFMYHDGSFYVEGTFKGAISNVEFSKKTSKTMLDIYANSLHANGVFKGESVLKIKKWLRTQMDKKEDVFLTAKEAVDHGFADEIFNSNWASLTEYTEEQLSR